MTPRPSAHNTITASMGEESSTPSNIPQTGLQPDTHAHLAADSGASDGEHGDTESVGSAPESETWDQLSVSSQSSREDDDNDKVNQQHMQAVRYAEFRRILSECRFHLVTAHDSLELFKERTATAARGSDAFKRQFDEFTERVLSDCEAVMNCTVRMHAYARDGVAPPIATCFNAQLTSQEMYNASQNITLTFDELYTMLDNAFEEGKHSFQIGFLSRLSKEEELSRKEGFCQIRDRLPNASQGQARTLRLASLWRTFIGDHDQSQGGSADHLGFPGTLPVPDLLSLLVGDPSSQPPLRMASTVPPTLPMAEEGD